MKFLYASIVTVLASLATQAEPIYNCHIERVHNGEYENIHDFLFEEYPALTIEMSESDKISVAIGAMIYDEADNILVDVAKIGPRNRWGIFYDGQMTERIDFYNDNSGKTKANVLAFLDETEGLKLIATFNCD